MAKKFVYALLNGKTLELEGDDQPSDEEVESIASEQGVKLQPITDEIPTSIADFSDVKSDSSVSTSKEGLLKRGWDLANKPLIDAPSRFGKSISDYITEPTLDDGPISSRLKGFLGGSLEGSGDVLSGLSSPLNLATTAAFGGSGILAKQGLKAGAAGLHMLGRGLSAPVAVHGGMQIVDPNTSWGEKAFGVAELAGGLAGIKSKVPTIGERIKSPEMPDFPKPNIPGHPSHEIPKLKLRFNNETGKLEPIRPTVSPIVPDSIKADLPPDLIPVGGETGFNQRFDEAVKKPTEDILFENASKRFNMGRPKETAEFLGLQENGEPLFNIIGGERDRSTVSGIKLKELGIEVPEIPSDARPMRGSEIREMMLAKRDQALNEPLNEMVTSTEEVIPNEIVNDENGIRSTHTEGTDPYIERDLGLRGIDNQLARLKESRRANLANEAELANQVPEVTHRTSQEKAEIISKNPGKTGTMSIAELMKLEGEDGGGILKDVERDRIDLIKNDIKQNGIKQPIEITVSRNKDGDWAGKYLVDDGHHRLAAAKELGMTDVPVKIVGNRKSAVSNELNTQSEIINPAIKKDLMDQFIESTSGPVKAGTPWLNEAGETVGHTTDTKGSTGVEWVKPKSFEPNQKQLNEEALAKRRQPQEPKIRIVTEIDGTNRVWINDVEQTKNFGPSGPTNAEIQQLYRYIKDPQSVKRLQELKAKQVENIPKNVKPTNKGTANEMNETRRQTATQGNQPPNKPPNKPLITEIPSNPEDIPAAMQKVNNKAEALKMAPPAKKASLYQEIKDTHRALLTGFDISYVGRQGKGLAPFHPVSFGRALKDMYQSLKSKEANEIVTQAIIDHPSGYFKPGVDDKGNVTPSFAEKAGLAFKNQEENLSSDWAVTGGKVPYLSKGYGRTVGKAYGATKRANEAFIHKLRSDVFASLMDEVGRRGVNPTTDLVLAEKIAKSINTSTGRGSFGSLEHPSVNPTTGEMGQSTAMRVLNEVFFAPKFMTSRVQMFTRVLTEGLNPIQKIDPILRKEALRSLFGIVGTGLLIQEVARQAGATIINEPTNPDFRKIKMGNTRIDNFSGLGPYGVSTAQFLMSKKTSSLTGKSRGLTGGFGGHKSKFGMQDKFELATDFAVNRVAPIPSLLIAWMRGRDFDGKSFEWKRALANRTAPLITQDLYDLAKEDPWLIPLELLPIMGEGIQTYGR